MYYKYISFININKEDKELNILYTSLKELHEKFKEKEEFTREEFTSYVLSRVGHNEAIELLCRQFIEARVGNEVLHEIVSEARKRAIAVDVALLAMDVSEGSEDLSRLLSKIEEFEEHEVSEEIEYVTDDLEELYEQTVATPGLRWRLRTLNEMLGSLRRGDFGFIFARPESGKTTFLASEVTWFAGQTELPILWFNNEEQGTKVQTRCYQAALGMTLDQLHADLKGNKQKYFELTKRNIRIIDDANMSKQQVERICKQVNPALIIFDQIDKIKGFDADREDLRLGSIYIWARELAKTYCPVIGVTQADGSGEGKKWLTMENVANAKTSKQAEADWILGIGKTNDSGFEYVRHLHLSKNKLSGDSDTVPALRHGRRDVVILPEKSRYKDVE